jgi:hypothetical protein
LNPRLSKTSLPPADLQFSKLPEHIEFSQLLKMSSSPQAPDQLPWDPNCTEFPSLKELPQLPDTPEGAAWVWGKDDQVCARTACLLLY